MEGDKLLSINIEFHKGILFIRLDGELTKNTIDKLKNDVTNMIKDNGIRNIVFNMSNLNCIDYYGINALLNNYEICHNNKGRSLMCGISDSVIGHQIRNSRLLNYMNETSDELTAINALNL